MRRPAEWKNWTQEERMAWLRKQRKTFKGGRKVLLKEGDAPRIWHLIKKYNNKSLVADLVGVSRRTIIRFLAKYPLPKDFVLNEVMQVTDYVEIQIWLKRLKGFANKNTINNYLQVVRKFYNYIKEKHPQRAKPSLWTSDDVSEFVFAHEPHLWHATIVPLRSLAKKAQAEFPNIDLGLLPTKKTHKAKRSLAGKTEYYLEPQQINNMIKIATTKMAKAMIAFLYNVACRTKALTNVRIEDLNLDKHSVIVKDKGGIVWNATGLTDKTCRLLREYLQKRGNPKSGWLFVNDYYEKLRPRDVNRILKEIGKKAGIEDKVLTAKTFRKSFVKNALEIAKVNPIVLAGTGKETKTCFCVGWTLEVLMKHYAPELMGQIEEDRQKFFF